jgi:hypothetical protein
LPAGGPLTVRAAPIVCDVIGNACRQTTIVGTGAGDRMIGR